MLCLSTRSRAHIGKGAGGRHEARVLREGRAHGQLEPVVGVYRGTPLGGCLLLAARLDAGHRRVVLVLRLCRLVALTALSVGEVIQRRVVGTWTKDRGD